MEFNIKLPFFGQLENFIADIPGWTPIDELYTLYLLAITTNDIQGDIVEIGSWCGRSAVVLGFAASQMRDTKVYAIDLFPEKNDWRKLPDGSYDFKVVVNGNIFGLDGQNTFWPEVYEKQIVPLYNKHNGVLDIFNENVKRAGLLNVVKSVKNTSDWVSGNNDLKIKLAFIDGDHSYNAVLKDLEQIEKKLQSGGWICFDDAFSDYVGVGQVINDRIIGNPDYEFAHLVTRKLFVARRK